MIELRRKLLRLWFELRRRKTIRTLAGYALLLAAVVGPASDILGGLGAPDLILQILICLLLALLPLTLVISWLFDITPQGLKRTEAAGESIYNRNSADVKTVKVDLGDLFDAEPGIIENHNESGGASIYFTIKVSHEDDHEPHFSDESETESKDYNLPAMDQEANRLGYDNNCVSLEIARRQRGHAGD